MYDTDTDDNQHFLFNFFIFYILFYSICKQQKKVLNRGEN